ncbi:MAG: Na/Pi cotransporter family protein [Bacteroidetes bacterium]|nr:Na/Pi cotransporter family protein [Bacteroidota bacterium]
MGLNIWLILGGVGIFLFGIMLLEQALQKLMSRRFKLFLRRQTGNTFRAIFSGTLITAALQSSSVVNFMVLAFVSSGVITLKNALAVIMGTNLGTTLNSWIVATIGFKLEIEAFAYPVAGLAGMALFIFKQKTNWEPLFKFLMGFSFLFIGLGLMKESAESEALQAVFSRFQDSGAWVFLILGFIATTITQSSAATVAITLSFLNQQLLGFESAMAVVIGSEVGTSVKLLLGSLDGVAVKQRVSVGNFLYNVVTTVVAFALLQPTAYFIQHLLGISNPLTGLATFQTLMNFGSIILFLPFLKKFSLWLEKTFNKDDRKLTLYIQPHQPIIAETSVELLQSETWFFINQCKIFAAHQFNIEEKTLHIPDAFLRHHEQHDLNRKSVDVWYQFLKEHYGEIQSYYIQVKMQELTAIQVRELDQLMAASRSGMHAVKCIHDVSHDLNELRNSAHEVKYNFLLHMNKNQTEFYNQLFFDASTLQDADLVYDKLVEYLKGVQAGYNFNLQMIYTLSANSTLSDVEIATLMNFNREIFTGNKSLIMSWKNYLLPTDLSLKFSDLPTYMA